MQILGDSPSALGLVSRWNTSNFSNLSSPSFIPCSLPTFPRRPPSSAILFHKDKDECECLVCRALAHRGGKWWPRNGYNTELRPRAIEIMWSIQDGEVGPLRMLEIPDTCSGLPSPLCGKPQGSVRGTTLHSVGELCVNQKWRDLRFPS